MIVTNKTKTKLEKVLYSRSRTESKRQTMSMIRMLNSYQKRKNETLKRINTMPVNNVLPIVPITAIIINYNNNNNKRV